MWTCVLWMAAAEPIRLVEPALKLGNDRLRAPAEVRRLDWSQDGRRLALHSDDGVAVWNVGRRRREGGAAGRWAGLSADGASLFRVVRGPLRGLAQEGWIELRALGGGKPQRVPLPPIPEDMIHLTVFQGPTWIPAVSPDQQRFAVWAARTNGRPPTMAYVLNAAGAALARAEVPWRPYPGALLEFSADGQCVIGAIGGHLWSWRHAEPAPPVAHEGYRSGGGGFGGGASARDFRIDASGLIRARAHPADAPANQSYVGAWKPGVAGLVETTLAHQGAASEDSAKLLDFARDGATAYLCGTDGERRPCLRALDLRTGATRDPQPGWDARSVSQLAASPDGKRLALAEWGPSVRVLDPETGADPDASAEPAWPLVSAAFSADGALFAAGGTDGRVHVYDVPAWRRRPCSTTGPAALGLAFAPGKDRLFVAGGRQGDYPCGPLQSLAIGAARWTTVGDRPEPPNPLPLDLHLGSHRVGPSEGRPGLRLPGRGEAALGAVEVGDGRHVAFCVDPPKPKPATDVQPKAPRLETEADWDRLRRRQVERRERRRRDAVEFKDCVPALTLWDAVAHRPAERKYELPGPAFAAAFADQGRAVACLSDNLEQDGAAPFAVVACFRNDGSGRRAAALVDFQPLGLCFVEGAAAVAVAGLEPGRSSEIGPALAVARFAAADGKPTGRWSVPLADRFADFPFLAIGADCSRKAVAFHAEQGLLARGDGPHVKLHDLRDGTVLAVLGDADDPLPRAGALAFAPDGRTLATTHLDGTIRVWRLPPR